MAAMRVFRYKQNRLQQLKGFCAVVETRSVSRAADRLRLSQPTVSLQIQSLERDLRASLFERRGPRPAAVARSHCRFLCRPNVGYTFGYCVRTGCRVCSGAHCAARASAFEVTEDLAARHQPPSIDSPATPPQHMAAGGNGFSATQPALRSST